MNLQTLGGPGVDEPNLPTLVDVVFTNNSAVGGGGLFNNNSQTTLDRVTFNGNTEYYRQTLTRYREGQALVLELTDAFTQWTNNRLALNAARASRLIRQAELERALAAYTF